MKRIRAAQQGFTLPELLVVIGLFAVLCGASLLLLRSNPMDIEKRNAERQTGTAYIVQAVTQYYKKHHTLPEVITEEALPISNEENGADLCDVLVPEFANDLPYDPLNGGFTVVGACNARDQVYITGYQIYKNKAGTAITVTNPNAEGGQAISITKHFK